MGTLLIWYPITAYKCITYIYRHFFGQPPKALLENQKKKRFVYGDFWVKTCMITAAALSLFS